MSVTQTPSSASITSTSSNSRPGSCTEATLPRSGQCLRERGGQPDPIGQLDQQRHATCDTQPLTVCRHFWRSEMSRSLHQLRVLLGRDSRPQHPILMARDAVPRPDLSSPRELEARQDTGCMDGQHLRSGNRTCFSAEQARAIGERIGIDWRTSRFEVEQFRLGLGVELEAWAA